MRFSDLLTMSVNNLFRRKLRTFLTVLGVVIGTASIVVMVSIGIGLKEFTIKQYSSYGSLTAIQVYNYDNGNSSDKKNPEDSFMTDETMKTFEKIPHVTSAYPDLNLNVIMRQGVYEGNVQLHGIPLGAMKNIKLGEGSLPTAETKDMEMVVGNMVAQNFSNAKTGKGYWDTGEMPDLDFINKPMFTIFDTDAYYQSKSNSGGDDGSQKVAAPKKYMLKTAGLVAGGPDEWSDYSYGVYVDLDKLKTQLKQMFKKKPIPGQPTNKKGKPYNYFVYEEATVNVDDMAPCKAKYQHARTHSLEPFQIAFTEFAELEYSSRQVEECGKYKTDKGTNDKTACRITISKCVANGCSFQNTACISHTKYTSGNENQQGKDQIDNLTIPNRSARLNRTFLTDYQSI